jgi:hypothetical protein
MATHAELLDELMELLDRVAAEANGWPKAELDDAVRALWKLLYPGLTAHNDHRHDPPDACPAARR